MSRKDSWNPESGFAGLAELGMRRKGRSGMRTLPTVIPPIPEEPPSEERIESLRILLKTSGINTYPRINARRRPK